ncbi:MAG TPA: MarR family transcriptional regulator [Solirubrobacteraceae bacterium]|jgi:DNA-binding MarR family transcriptional regulator|nr:MarR family transcriptional regulator [Solirubrobacteraceae bacterium]
MLTVPDTGMTRSIDEVAEDLPARVAVLTRLFLKRTGISRMEAGVLWAAAAGPRRITELAEREGCTQPAITRLVDRLQARGWVVREPDPGDGRVVLVSLTAEGRAVADRLRNVYREMLHGEMSKLAEEDVRVLDRAIEILDELIARLRERQP